MKEKHNDGGRAFPYPGAAHPTDLPWNCDKGMSLWHFFAAAALQGISTQHGWTQPPHVIASRAGELADAMIKEAQRRFPAS